MRFREFITEGDVIDLTKIRRQREKQQQDARYDAIAQDTRNRESAFQTDYDALRDELYELRTKKFSLFGWPNTDYAEILSFIDDIDVPDTYRDYPNWYQSLRDEDRELVFRTFANRENTTKLRNIVHTMADVVLEALKRHNREPYFSILKPRLSSLQQQLAMLNKLDLFANTKIKKPLRENHSVEDKIQEFVDFACKCIGLDNPPEIILIDSKKHAVQQGSFGGYSLDDKNIKVNIAGRHVADIMRTLAHELVHAHQDRTVEGGLQSDDGATGSPYENEANSKAGEIMRMYAKKNPAIFESRNAAR